MTLVEMVVVLVIIAVLTSSVVVALEGRQDAAALRLAAADLATAIRFAARQSSATGRPHRLAFDEHRRSYRVERVTDQARFEPVRGMAGDPHALPAGVRIERIERAGTGGAGGAGAAGRVDPIDRIERTDGGSLGVSEPVDALLLTGQGGGFGGTIELVSEREARDADTRSAVLTVVAETGQVHVRID